MSDEKRRESAEETEIDLLELFLHLLSRWKLLVLGLLIGAVIGGGLALVSTPVYESEAMLFILSETTSITSYADLQIGSELSTDFVVIATSKPVLDTAIVQVEEETGVTLTRDEITEITTVENLDDTRILTITVQYEDAQVACSLANAIMETTAEQVASIMKSDLPTTIESAEVATQPESNGFVKKAVIGGLIGLIIMMIIFIIPFLLNDKINSADDVEKYVGTTVLALIPLDRSVGFGDEADKSEKRKKSKKKAAG